MAESDNIFLEGEQAFKSSKLDYEQILMIQIMKITKSGSREFTGGMFDVNRVTGETIYIESPEEEYMNSIIQLDNLLSPYHDRDYIKELRRLKELLDKDSEIENLKLEADINKDGKINKDEKIKIVSKIRGLKVDYFTNIFKQEMKLIDRMNLLMGGFSKREVI